MVLPPGALAYEYAEHNIQQSYVPPGAWEPSPEALQEAHAMSQHIGEEVRMTLAGNATHRRSQTCFASSQGANSGLTQL